MNISIIQSNLVWENIEENLKRFSDKIDSIKEQTDLIVLPEMFATGFSMKPVVFAEYEELQLDWLSIHAEKKNAVLTGSIITEKSGNYFNSLIWMNPDGTYKQYDKRHLFTFAREDKHYSAGDEQLHVNLSDWKIKPLICYDLRFPVWSRNKQNYDVLIYVANWPERRSDAWKTLLKARAIENQAYVIGVNRVGEDGNGIYHSGDSAVIDPKGNIVSKTQAHEESVEAVSISLDELNAFRVKFPVGNDADDFVIS